MVDAIALPLLKRATTILVLTSQEGAAVKRLRGVADVPMVILGNPLPERIPQRADTDGAGAVFIARLHPRKRVLDFLDAARHAAAKEWPESYSIIGPDWGDLDEVLAAAEQLGNLTYGGSVSSDEVLDRLCASSVFVICSDDEPWGNVLASALAVGVPVVVTSSSALAPEVERACAGIVVRNRSPTDIAQAVHAIVADPELASRMSRNGREYAASRLSNSSQMSAIAKLYESVADE